MIVSEQGLDFAKAHINNFYDSDFFSKPFEYKAIQAFWDEVKDYLLNKDMDNLNVKIPRFYAAPKVNGGYRIVHQLDPLDWLIYTGFAYDISKSVEDFRENDQIACSYRINTDPGGNFFSGGHGFDVFKQRRLHLSNEYSWALITDLTDFYNQIYVHRLQNSIEICDTSLETKSKDLEQFILRLNNKVSKGIPVGPAASIIMAEALLMDVDRFILSNNRNYVRYVDDIAIFSNSKIELEMLLHDLSVFLYSDHRLTIANTKTKIVETSVFREEELIDPESLEIEHIHNALEEFFGDLSNYPDWEPIDLEDLSRDDQNTIRINALRTLMDDIINQDSLDLGLARHILRKSRRLRTRAILSQLLDNFEFFLPVLPDVILYLEKVCNEAVIERNIDKFEMIVGYNYAKYDWVKYWLQDYFVKYDSFRHDKTIQHYFNMNNDIRALSIKAIKDRNITFVHSYKNRLDNYGGWDKRALIYACSILPSGERKPLMQSIISNSESYLDRIVAKYVNAL